MSDIFSTEGFWVLLSFITFVVIAFKPAKAALLKMLDDKAMHILHKLQEAEKVRLEAEELLNEARHQQELAKKEIEAILSKAQLEADALVEDAKNEVEHFTAKRRELALQKISQEEANIVHDLKDEVLNEALKLVKSLLLSELNTTAKMEMIEDSINNLKKFAN